MRAAALLGLAGVAPAALADTATLTISGRVLPGTCTLAAPAIPLDTIRVDQAKVGDNAVKTGALNFTGCVGVARAKLSFDGTAASGDPQRWQNTATTDPATGIAVALLAGASGSTYLKKGDTGIVVTVSGASASYPLRAAYYVANVATLVPGTVRSDITVTAAYE
ncbi:type 1 fimbrial protein [Stenotrophomonas cyclobalanopsidis]|uniref:Type 1 fimbrial protein n=2 Tax=Stenotrophomonas cyclobalanopsidis TaxID=2771362 RepID=A0ABQ6T566_9GAMM|nr:type 1 fimbrial protein [Stenotrophomonas cyclobalanopsidis]